MLISPGSSQYKTSSIYVVSIKFVDPKKTAEKAVGNTTRPAESTLLTPINPSEKKPRIYPTTWEEAGLRRPFTPPKELKLPTDESLYS